MRLTRSVSRALRQFVTVVSSLALMAGVMVGFQATAAQAAPVTFSSPGTQNWTVPSGWDTAFYTVCGARGASPDNLGGYGAKVTGQLNVTPGTQYQILVGGAGAVNGTGGYNGGGTGGAETFDGAGIHAKGYGGGGASEIRLASDRLIVAGGGGGGAAWNQLGGNAGTSGTKGSGGNSRGGNGGTTTGGGSGGSGSRTGLAGSLGQGGTGGAGVSGPGPAPNVGGAGGGGGGGGLYGGGGGAGAGPSELTNPGGGGGGSSKGATIVAGSSTTGCLGNGSVILAQGFDIDYDANGGSNPPAVQMAADGSSATVSSGAGMTRPSYTLASWNTALDGSGTTIALGGSFTITSDTTLYAQWTFTPPQVTSVSPTSGPGVGGTQITISGSNLDSSSTVTVGGLPCTNPVVNGGGTQITCLAPAGAALGSVDVVVDSAGIEVEEPNGYTYTQSYPVISSIAPSPASGPSAGGTSITLTGTDFGPGSSVAVGGVACAVSAWTATTLTCTTGGGMPVGSQDVVVTNNDGGTVTEASAFDVVSSPTISSISPNVGTSSGGTQIAISGTQFATGATVTIGSELCVDIAVVNATTITCTTPVSPNGSIGAKNVVVTNVTDSGTVTSSGGFTYTQSQPTIVGIEPSSGVTFGGTEVVLTGTQFAPGMTVLIGNSECEQVEVLSSTSATCVTSAGTAGLKEVMVINQDNGTSDPNQLFTYTTSTPTVSGFSPTTGPSTGGTVITINGSGFYDGANATVGGVPCSSVTVVSDSEIVCTTGASMPPGAQDVVVKNSDGGEAIADGKFIVTSTPTVTGISPEAGPATGGTQITISGSEFLAGATVTVGGVACSVPIVNVGNQTITCTTPAGAPGDPEIVVTNPDQGTVTVNNEFTYVSVPTINADGVSPSGGNSTGGTQITISGTGFIDSPDTKVFVGDHEVPANLCTSIQINEDGTQITCTTPGGSVGAQDVTVVNPDAEFDLGTSTAVDAFEYVVPPVVTDVNPSSGPASGTQVTIVGTGFNDGMTVLIGGELCTDIELNEEGTQFTCMTSALTPGTYDLQIDNTNGGTVTIADAFTALSEPSIAGVSPTSGNNTGGTEVTITGTNFESDATVTVGGVACTSVTVVSDTEITCTTPAGSNGATDIVVANGDGGAVTAEDMFTFVTPPTIDNNGISPDEGPASGTPITISGTGFIDSPDTKVLIGDVECTDATITATEITCTTPDLDPGNYNVTINNADGGTAAVANGFKALSEPTIADVSPDKIPHTGGVTVTIAGSNFVTGASVTIGGAACNGVTVVSDIEITCTAPAGTEGQSADVVVTNADDGTVTAANTVEFVSAPEIDSISPVSGGSSGGTTVTITGSEFAAGVTVAVGGQSCTNVTVVSATQITCAMPAGNPGDVDIVVTNSDGGSFTAPDAFTYISEPTIAGVSPSGGNNTGGTTITITSTQFVDSPAPTVTVGGTACTNIVVVSDTEITCTTPAGANGAVDVTVTNADTGTFTATNAFAYVDPPTVSGIDPDNGSGPGGTVVMIDGTGFAPGVTVAIGGVPCTAVTLFSATQLTCVTGAHATGAADVVVANTNGGSANEAGGFTYNQSTPTIEGISPDGGNNTGGSTITITGTDFGDGAVVMIGDQECTDVQVADGGTTITCKTPAQTDGTYDVTVTNIDNGTITLADAFTYVTAPAVSGVSPKTGSTAGGETVTINGSNFAGGVTVMIGGKACAPVTVVSSAKITCKAPSG